MNTLLIFVFIISATDRSVTMARYWLASLLIVVQILLLCSCTVRARLNDIYNRFTYIQRTAIYDRTLLLYFIFSIISHVSGTGRGISGSSTVC